MRLLTTLGVVLTAALFASIGPTDARMLNDSPNSGYCPDGRRVRNLRACANPNVGRRVFVPSATSNMQQKKK